MAPTIIDTPPPTQFMPEATSSDLQPPTPPKPRHRLTPGWWFIVLALSLLFSGIVIAGVSWFTSAIHIRVKLPGEVGGPGLVFEPGSPGEKVILMMGVDVNYLPGHEHTDFQGTRSDTMMLVRISPHHGTVSVISIPRDSKVYLAEGHGIDKINAAHAVGGPELAVQTVQDSFGIPVDNYIVVNYKGIQDLVDALGGVSVYVDQPMHYRDNTAKLDINFDPGKYDLDGKHAEAFLRFRHDQMGDIGRIRRQQYFVSALAQKMQSPWVITRLPSLVNLAKKYVVTDMAPEDMLRLAFFAKNVQPYNIRVATLPAMQACTMG
jgi:LCP family protein required for cell wall assembly